MEQQSQSASASVGSEIYTGVAALGRFQAVVGATLAVIIALTLIIIGASKRKWGLVGGGVLLGAFGVGFAWLSFKSKPFAAIEGANDLFHL